MKNLVKRMYKGVPTLFIGNNKKPIGYDNWYAKQFELENNVIPEVSLIFYDINDAANLFGINGDLTDVSEWNNVLNYGNYGGFVDINYNPIAFESCVVDGNKLTLIPFNNDYSVIYGIELYEYDFLVQYVFKDAIFNGLNLIDVYVEGEELARNINDDISSSVGNYNEINDENYRFILDSYSYTGTTFNGDNLTSFNKIFISDCVNLINVELNNLPNLDILRLNNNEILPSLDTSNLNITQLTISGNEMLTGLTLNSDLVNLVIDTNAISDFNNNNLPSLINFLITGNEIKEFNNNILPLVSGIDGSYNKLIEVKNNQLDSIIILTLTSNFITGFTGNYLPTINTLELSSNNISVFSGNTLSTIEVLNLTNNSGLTTFDSVGLNTLLNGQFSTCNIITFNANNLNSIVDLNLFDNQLNVSSVNHILAKLVEFNNINGLLFLDGGTNAAPTGQGLIDLATLQSRGWVVSTN